jgi:hypothetical protein
MTTSVALLQAQISKCEKQNAKEEIDRKINKAC